MRGEVEDLQVACEAALATANAPLEALEDAGGDLAGAQLRCAWWGVAGCAGAGHACGACRRLHLAEQVGAAWVLVQHALLCLPLASWPSTPPFFLTHPTTPSLAPRSVARQELELAGLQLDGSAWGGASARKLQPAQ